MAPKTNLSRFDITVVVLFHDEGWLAFYSLKSLEHSRHYAEQFGLSIQTIVVLDSPDAQTRQQLNKFFALGTFSIDALFEIQVLDPGLARNFGVARAAGEYIAFLDGDDLYSQNWLYEAHRICQKNPRFIVHPEINFFFGRSCYWWRHLAQTARTFKITNLVTYNYWTALAFTCKTNLQKVPYQAAPACSGYGYEDWHWNCETIAADQIHCVALGTCHFLRLKTHKSRLRLHSASGAIIRSSSFFLKLFDLAASNKKRSVEILRDYYSAFSVWTANRVGNLLIKLNRFSIFCDPKRHHSGFRRILSPLNSMSLPEWLMCELENTAKIEPALNPVKNVISEAVRIQYPPLIEDQVGILYLKMLSKVKIDGATIPYVYLIDSTSCCFHSRAILSQIRATSQITKQRCLIVLFGPVDPDWLAMTVAFDLLPIDSMTTHSSSDIQVMAVTRLLLEVKPGVIHNFNCPVGWTIYSQFGLALRNSSILTASFFYTDFNLVERYFGFAPSCFATAIDKLRFLFVDQEICITLLENRFGIMPELITHLPPPIEEKSFQQGFRRTNHWREYKNTNKILCLLDGRWCREDNLLPKMASNLPHLTFHILFLVTNDDFRLKADWLACKNIVKEQFDSSAAKYYVTFDAVLNLSEDFTNDHFVLELAAMGIPIILPEPRIDHFATAPCNTDSERTDEIVAFFCQSILQIYEDPKSSAEKARDSLELAYKHYSWQQWRNRLVNLSDYLLPQSL